MNTPVDRSIKLVPLRADEEIVDAMEYKSIIGALNYAALLTRPDIAFLVSLVSRYMQKPGKMHWNAVMRILRYLKGTKNYGLRYSQDEHFDKNNCLEAFCDSDWAEDIADRKSTSGYIVTMGGTIISHKSGKQDCIATSSVQAEYIAASTAAREVIWLRRLLKELGFEQKVPTLMRMDNTGAKDLAENEMIRQRTKHIDIRYHFIRE